MPMIRKLPRISVILLLGAAVAVVLVIAVMGADLFARLKELRAAPRDNVQWTLVQVQNEYTRFRLAISETTIHGDPAKAELSRRFDILYSRFNILNTAPMFAAMRRDEAFAAQLEEAFRHLQSMAIIIDASPEELQSRIGVLRAESEHFDKEVQTLVLDAIRRFAASSDADRDELTAFITRVAFTIGGLVLALIGLAVFLWSQADVLRKRTVALTENRNRTAAITQVSLDCIVVSDSHGKIIEFNDAAVASFGYSREQAVGADMASLLIPQRYREAHRNGMVRFIATGATKVIGRRIEIDALHAGGHEFPVELALGTASTEEGPIFIAHMRDISERRQQQSRLEDALAKAQAGAKAKERFLAVMSHEIRTPLNGVLGVLDLLRHTELDQAQQDYVKVASQSGEALLSLISDILDVSKMEAQGISLTPVPVLVRRLLQDTTRIAAMAAPGNGNTVAVDIGEDVPPAIMVDESRLRQVLLNFLSNAQKFTHQGKIDVAVKVAGMRDNRTVLEFSVTDTGIGIDPARKDDLFRFFSTLDDSYQRRTGGTGLGLAISRRIVEAMGGECHADGELGRGSRFWFTVACEDVEDLPMNVTQAKSDPKVASLLNILVAEDNPTNLMVTRGMLEAAGHAVHSAVNGLEAVEAATAMKFDVILMDVSMPELDGIEAARRIRALPQPFSEVPIVALTANSTAEDAEEVAAAGMDAFLSKPIRRADLLGQIGRIVNERAQRADPESFDRAVFDQLCSDLPQEVANAVLENYSEELDRRIGELRAAAREQDAHAFQKLCHALAGSSATVGAMLVAKRARELEMMCKAGDAGKAMAVSDDLEAIAGTTAATIQKVMSAG